MTEDQLARTAEEKPWVSAFGVAAPELERELLRRVEARIGQGKFNWHNVRYLEKVSFAPVRGKLQVSEGRLEKLRRLCQLWDVHLKGTEISSHRPVIGPVIVFGKKILYRILSVLLKDFVRQQKSFNAGVVSLLAELSGEDSESKSDKERS